MLSNKVSGSVHSDFVGVTMTSRRDGFVHDDVQMVIRESESQGSTIRWQHIDRNESTRSTENMHHMGGVEIGMEQSGVVIMQQL